MTERDRPENEKAPVKGPRSTKVTFVPNGDGYSVAAETFGLSPTLEDPAQTNSLQRAHEHALPRAVWLPANVHAADSDC